MTVIGLETWTHPVTGGDGESAMDLSDIQAAVAAENRFFTDTEYRPLPTDLGLAGVAVSPPSTPNSVARELIKRLQQRRGTHLVRWQSMWLIYSPSSSGCYRYAPDGDDTSVVADMVLFRAVP